jgi:flagellar basal-body rod protein FlgC
MGDGVFGTFDISASGMSAERLRMNVIAHNIANAKTTRTKGGGPYQRRYVVFEEALAGAQRGIDNLMGEVGAGVQARIMVDTASEHPEKYAPGHKDADPETGMVRMPNVNPIMEMLDMMTAARGYEANVMAISAAKQMILKALEI